MPAATDNRPSPVPIVNSELLEYDSKCVGQHYLIKVRLPETHAESTEAYPVALPAEAPTRGLVSVFGM